MTSQRGYNWDVLNEYLARGGVPKTLRATKPLRALSPPECLLFGRRMPIGSQMILSGPVGTGKTMAALWVVRRRWHHLAKQGKHVPTFAFLSARDLYRLVFDKADQRLRNLREVPLLILDDMGATYDSQWPLDEMEGLLCYRADEERPTIVTTNLTPEMIQTVIPRAYDRMSAPYPGPGFVAIVRPSMRQEPESAELPL